MNKQQLAAKIWESANQMRSKIEANEYKDYILGFIFYKYLSDRQIQIAKQNELAEEDIQALSEEDTETVDFFKDKIGYFISYDNLFSTWVKMGLDFNVSNVREALSAFSRLISDNHKKVYDGIFKTLETGLSKLGDDAIKQTKAISGLIHLIKDIPMDGKQDYDVLGFIYEYLISMFAANAGKKAGEFYTPHEVSLMMSEIMADHLKEKKEIKIYDPTSGSGSLLINIGRCVAKHMDDADNIKYYAQELKQNTYNLTRMNLVMRGILPHNIVTRNGDTLEEDWPYFDESDPAKSYDPLYVDAVVSNPPYSQKWDSEHKENDPRYSDFGLAPKTKADYAFLLHDLYHLKPDGIMTIVLPHGVLFRGGEEGEIRRNLIEKNHIDAIIGLPANIFFGTGIPTIVLVLKKNRDNTDTLIVDASKGFEKVGKNNKLRASDIKKITDTVIQRKPDPKYSKVVKLKDIRENDYNLNIPRYVDSSPNAESWDIYASMFGGIPNKEINELQKYWDAFPELKNSLFTEKTVDHSNLAVSDVKTTLNQHSNLIGFIEKFETSFADFKDYLKIQLLDQMEDLKISKQEEILSEDIFKRLKSIPLIDKYQAYQLLDDEWVKTAVDLEIIQTEGFLATKMVDPNMVLKRKNGKEQEIQEGWIGRIMPFDLVQETYLKDDLLSIKQKENRLQEITGEYEEILTSFSEEEKEAETVNEAKDAFVNAAVTKEAKQIKADAKKNGAFTRDSYEDKILKVGKLIAEEKALKKEVKLEIEKLHLQTKQTIENLSDKQVFELLESKWVTPLVNSINQLPQMIIADLKSKLEALANKYATTYSDVANEIEKTENSLASLMNQLTGSETDMLGIKEFTSLLKSE